MLEPTRSRGIRPASRLIPSGMAAADAPWMARPKISSPMLSVTAVIADPTTRVPTATSSSRRLPHMSPSRPMIGTETAATSRVEVISQLTLLAEVSRRAGRMPSTGTRTVDGIAAASGMSRRTFFRYFTGKDELVLERLLEAGDRVAVSLRERPADEPAWTALRVAFDEIVELQELHADRSRPLQLMLRDEPGVRASLLERQRRWHQTLTPLVARRLARRGSARGPDVRAAALTASAVACLDAAQLVWAENPGSRLSLLLDEAMGAVASAPTSGSAAEPARPQPEP